MCDKKRGLLQVTFKYSYNTAVYNKCIYELTDNEKFIPDGQTVAYVKSNFCYKYHPDYEHLSIEAVEREKAKNKKSNRGRRLKPKEKKKSKKNNGTNDQFGSAIAFGVISGERIHGIKIFRVNSGNISKTTHDDSDEYVKGVINSLLAYINNIKPDLNMVLLSTDCRLKNLICKFPLEPEDNPTSIVRNVVMAKLQYPLTDHEKLVQYYFPLGSKTVINLYHLRRLFELANYNKYNRDFWGNIVVRFCFNGKNTGLTIIIRDSRKCPQVQQKKESYVIYNLKLHYTGNLHIFGGNDIVKIERYRDIIFSIISTNKWLIQQGYKAGKN
jgi:hypothetical protein